MSFGDLDDDEFEGMMNCNNRGTSAEVCGLPREIDMVEPKEEEEEEQEIPVRSPQIRDRPIIPSCLGPPRNAYVSPPDRVVEDSDSEDMDEEVDTEEEFFKSPGFMHHDDSYATCPPIVLFLKNEDFVSVQPESVSQLSSDPLRIHMKDLVENFGATCSHIMTEQVKKIEGLKEDLERWKTARKNKYRQALLKLKCRITDIPSEEIADPVSPEDDFKYKELTEERETEIKVLESSIGMFKAANGRTDFKEPIVTVIINRALGASGIPIGYFYIIKVNDPNIEIGNELELQIVSRNDSFHRTAMGKSSTMSRKDRAAKLSERGRYAYTHINSLHGPSDVRGSLSNAVDMYFDGETDFCKRQFEIVNSYLNDNTPIGEGRVSYLNPLHPCNVFTMKSAIEKAKKSLGGLHPSQSDPDKFFKIIEYAANQSDSVLDEIFGTIYKKSVLAFRPQDSVVIPVSCLDPAQEKEIPLPRSLDGNTIGGGNKFFNIIAGEGILVPPLEVLKNLNVDGYCKWDGGTEAFVSKVAPCDKEKIKNLPTQYRRLLESQMMKGDGDENEQFMITFPEVVINRAYCLRKRAENAPRIGMLIERQADMLQHMERLRDHIPDEVAERIDTWLNHETSERGLEYFAYNTPKLETEEEKEMFNYYTTWLSIRQAHKQMCLEMSKIAWRDILRCVISPEPFAETTVVGMKKFMNLARHKRWPSTCHHSVDNMSTYANMMIYKQRGYQTLLKLMPGKPTADCVLMEDVFASAWRFNTGLHPNAMIAGPNSSHKSFIVELLSKFMLVENVHKTTENAYNVGEDRLYKIHVQEEAQSSMTGVKDGREMQSGDEGTKNRMTNSLIVTIQCWVDENGERKMTFHYSRCMETDIVLTNRRLPPRDSPLRSRYLVFAVVLDEKPTGAKIRDYAHVLSAMVQTKEIGEFIHNQWLHNWYAYLLMRWNEMLMVSDVTMDACITVTNLMLRAFKDTEIISEEVAMRTADMIMEICKIRTFKLAIWREFFTEHGLLHHHFAKDADGMIDDMIPADFDPRVFITHMSRHLVCTPEIAVDTATACASTFAPLISQKVLQYLNEMSLNMELIPDSESDTWYHRYIFDTKKNFFEKVAGNSMNKETVEDAVREMEHRMVPKDPRRPNGIKVPLIVLEEDASRRRYVLKVHRCSMDSTPTLASAQMEKDIVKQIKMILSHCFAYPDQRMITSFFYTLHYTNPETRKYHGKRMYDLRTVIEINPDDSMNLHTVKNPVKMGKMETALFHGSVKSGADRSFKRGNTVDYMIITRDFEESAMATHSLLIGESLDPKLHSANWANHCINLRRHMDMPKLLRERFNAIEMIEDYPHSEAIAIMKSEAECHASARSIVSTSKLIRDFGVKHLDTWRKWSREGKLLTFESLLKNLKEHYLNTASIRDKEEQKETIRLLTKAEAIRRQANSSNFGSHGTGMVSSSILYHREEDANKIREKLLEGKTRIVDSTRKKRTTTPDTTSDLFAHRTDEEGAATWDKTANERFSDSPSRMSTLRIEDSDTGEIEEHILVDTNIDPDTGRTIDTTQYYSSPTTNIEKGPSVTSQRTSGRPKPRRRTIDIRGDAAQSFFEDSVDKGKGGRAFCHTSDVKMKESTNKRKRQDKQNRPNTGHSAVTPVPPGRAGKKRQEQGPLALDKTTPINSYAQLDSESVEKAEQIRKVRKRFGDGSSGSDTTDAWEDGAKTIRIFEVHTGPSEGV